MKLIDSNVIIYPGAEENSCLRELFYESGSFFSSISEIKEAHFRNTVFNGMASGGSVKL